jgi:hypothetical protein
MFGGLMAQAEMSPADWPSGHAEVVTDLLDVREFRTVQAWYLNLTDQTVVVTPLLWIPLAGQWVALGRSSAVTLTTQANAARYLQPVAQDNSTDYLSQVLGLRFAVDPGSTPTTGNFVILLRCLR